MNDQNKSESRFIKGRTDIKIVVLGSSGTGKTSLCNLWINNTFSEEYKATVMSEFSFKMYNYKGNYYKVQIWDLAGQDKNIYTSKVTLKIKNLSRIQLNGKNQSMIIPHSLMVLPFLLY